MDCFFLGIYFSII